MAAAFDYITLAKLRSHFPNLLKLKFSINSFTDSNKQIKHDVKSNASIVRFTLLHRDNCTFHSLQHLHDHLIHQLREMVFGGKFVKSVEIL
jgi:hypothetical protein